MALTQGPAAAQGTRSPSQTWWPVTGGESSAQNRKKLLVQRSPHRHQCQTLALRTLHFTAPHSPPARLWIQADPWPRRHGQGYKSGLSRGGLRTYATGAAILKAGPNVPACPRSHEGELQNYAHNQESWLGEAPWGRGGAWGGVSKPNLAVLLCLHFLQQPVIRLDGGTLASTNPRLGFRVGEQSSEGWVELTI